MRLKSLIDNLLQRKKRSSYDTLVEYLDLQQAQMPSEESDEEIFEKNISDGVVEEEICEVKKQEKQSNHPQKPEKPIEYIRPSLEVINSESSKSGVSLYGIYRQYPELQEVDELVFPIGVDDFGSPMFCDCSNFPNMLICGANGSGKSTYLHSVIISTLLNYTPSQVRLLMVDVKIIELQRYNRLPHLLAPVITDVKKAHNAMSWVCNECARRAKLFSTVGVRNIVAYNENFPNDRLARIILFFDGLLEMSMDDQKEVEERVRYITTLGRVVGVHIIAATIHSPNKALATRVVSSFPNRIGFVMSGRSDSLLMMGVPGAEKLTPHTEVLFNCPTTAKGIKLLVCYITDDGINTVINAVLAENGKRVQYDKNSVDSINQQVSRYDEPNLEEEEDELLYPAIEIVAEYGQASVSVLQRRLKLGYSRASRLIDQMEERGIVGPFEGSKPRPVLVSRDEWKEIVSRRKKQN